MNKKKCIHCGSPITKKNGIVNGRQLYKCHACNKQFLGGERRDPRDILDEYLDGKQTYRQLADRYGCSARTIQRCVDKAKTERNDTFSPVADVVMDTTYAQKPTM